MLTVSVVYMTDQIQELVTVQCRVGTTLQQAIERSGLCEQYPEIELQDGLVGVFGMQKKLTDQVVDQDRVEIYRPLLVSPTEARRLRAKSKNRVKEVGKA